MRIWHRLKTVLPLLLTVSMSAAASAQGIVGPPGGGYPAVPVGPAGYSAIGYQGMAPSFQSHPYISPFDNAIEEHFSSDGLWFRDTVNHFEKRGRRFTYDFQVQWLYSKVRNFTGITGDPFARTALEDNGNAFFDSDTLNFRVFQPPYLDQIANPQMSGLQLSFTAKNRNGWRVGAFGMINPDSSKHFSVREERDKYRLDEVDAIVLGITGGTGNPGSTDYDRYRDETDLGIAIDLLSQFNNTAFDAFIAANVDFGLRGGLPDILERTLISEISLPLQNGFVDSGVFQRFDIDFAIRHSVETYAGGLHVETGTLFKRHGVKFRGLLGGRYMRINEGFHFTGIDSGLVYDQTNSVGQVDRVDNDGDFIVDELGEETGGGGTAGGGATTSSIAFEGYNPSTVTLIRAFVDNKVESDLAGPEIGFGYDITEGKGIRISGSTRVGALLNNERVRLSGDNIGQFMAGPQNDDDNDDFSDVDQTMLISLFDTTPDPVTGLTQNAFTDTGGAQHVSPMFEQSLTADIPLFGGVPILKDMELLEHATLQVGWTFLWIGEVADPANSIVWESNPRAGLFPTVKVRRNDFYQHSFRLGANFEY